jgi:AAA domain
MVPQVNNVDCNDDNDLIRFGAQLESEAVSTRQTELRRLLPVGNNGQPAQSDRLPVLNSVELAESNVDIEYLVDRFLVRGQPCILAGPKKTLKTNILIDLVLSLSSGTPFLAKFEVLRPCRVGLLSGESGQAVIAETARRIAVSKGWTLHNFSGVFWGFKLPRLDDPRDIEALIRLVTENELEVLVVDPVYLAMALAESASNLFAVGQKLAALNSLTFQTGVTIILCHHMIKRPENPFEPPELEHIAWAGFQEWARQWMLIGRRRRYDPDLGGHHELWLSAGGSAGHSELWAVNIDEGTRQDLGGRRWDIEILKPSAARAEADAAQEESRESRRAEKQARKDQRDRERAIQGLKHFPNGETLRKLREKVPSLAPKRLSEVIKQLVQLGTVDRSATKKNGQECDLYKLNAF